MFSWSDMLISAISNGLTNCSLIMVLSVWQKAINKTIWEYCAFTYADSFLSWLSGSKRLRGPCQFFWFLVFWVFFFFFFFAVQEISSEQRIQGNELLKGQAAGLFIPEFPVPKTVPGTREVFSQCFIEVKRKMKERSD